MPVQMQLLRKVLWHKKQKKVVIDNATNAVNQNTNNS